MPTFAGPALYSYCPPVRGDRPPRYSNFSSCTSEVGPIEERGRHHHLATNHPNSGGFWLTTGRFPRVGAPRIRVLQRGELGSSVDLSVP
jgi:hypothetical protein